MNKKLLIGIIVVILILLVTLSYPSFIVLKPFGKSGGFVGLPIDRICECNGIMYNYYPWGCNDCTTEYYCFGTTSNCRCFNESKAEKLTEQYPEGFSDLNRKYDTYQELLDNVYDPCP